MKLFTEAFLDKWEAHATKGPEQWQKKPASNIKRWVTALNPHLRMQPTQKYNLRLCLCQAAYSELPFVAAVFVLWLFPLAYSWLQHPFVLHNQNHRKPLVSILSHSGFYFYLWLVLGLLTVNCLVWLPRFYFWNRRAERLRREPPLPDIPAEAVAIDTSVWPPPPKIPTA